MNRANSQYSTDQLLQDLCSYDFVRSFPPDWQLPSDTSNENQSINHLKTKIDRFCRNHSDIIIDIKNYFYDEFMVYSLKHALKIPFNRTDMIKTERLLHRFFVEHEKHIQIIYNYFIDDIKTYFVNNQFVSLTSQFPQINSILNRGGCEVLLLLLKTKGASFLTSLLYRTHIVINNNENTPEQEAINHQVRIAPLVAYMGFLFVIFGWKLFTIVFYFIIGLILAGFFVYLAL